MDDDSDMHATHTTARASDQLECQVMVLLATLRVSTSGTHYGNDPSKARAYARAPGQLLIKIQALRLHTFKGHGRLLQHPLHELQTRADLVGFTGRSRVSSTARSNPDAGYGRQAALLIHRSGGDICCRGLTPEAYSGNAYIGHNFADRQALSAADAAERL